MKLQNNQENCATGSKKPNICPTGIITLDKLLGGGLRKNTTTLVAGGAGVGKTTFVTQFLLTGVKQYGETGLLILTETSKKEWLELMQHMKLDPGVHLDKEFLVTDLSPKNIILGRDKQDIGIFGQNDPLMWLITEFQKKFPKIPHSIKRLAIDSFFPFRVSYAGRNKLFLLNLSILRKLLKSLGITTVIASEVKGEYEGRKYTMEEYIGDTIIHLRRNKKNNEIYRTIEVSKARFIFRDHEEQRYLYKITPGVGIEVSTKVQAYE